MALERLIQTVSRIVFDHRKAWLAVFAVLTILAGLSRDRGTMLFASVSQV